jgi:lipopolysaccharide export system protein LptA
LILVAGGCVRIEAPSAGRDNAPDAPELKVLSKRVTLESFSPNGKRLWVIKAANAVGEVRQMGDSAEMKDVDAVLYEGRDIPIRIHANSGIANESNGKLALWGDVEVFTDDRQTRLTCDKIVWNREGRTLVATGTVTGESHGMVLGPANEARARFAASNEKMKSAVSALVLTSLALQGGQVRYRDKAGNMDVSAGAFRVESSPESDRWDFRGEGPFVARWKKQGLTVTGGAGSNVSGSFVPRASNGAQAYELQHAKFGGALDAHLDGQRGKMDLVGLKSFQIDSVEGGKAWAVKGSGGPFQITLPTSNAVITGNEFSGTATNERSGSPQWETADFIGGVRAVVTQEDKKTKKKFTIVATSSRAHVNRAAASLTLTGNVTANGDHPAMGPGGAEISAPRVTVIFDKEMRLIKSVTMERE